MGIEFKQRGYDIVFYDPFTMSDNDLDAMVKKEAIAVIDVNSIITNAIWRENRLLLDEWDVPFYNLIVDHPMHLDARLDVPYKNYNVICVDQDHCHYIEKFYPHIQKVIYMPFAGTKSSKSIPFVSRTNELLFPATYVPPLLYRERLIHQDPCLLSFAMDIYELLKAREELTFEAAAWLVNEPYMLHCAGRLESLSNMDRYLRALFREELVQMLIESGIKVTVMGENWGCFESNNRNLIRLGARTYQAMLDEVADSKMVLNIQPLFTQGPHDRILNAMVNGSISVTDPCGYILEEFNTSQDLILYTRKNIRQLPYLLEKATQDIAVSGRKRATEEHCWSKRVDLLISEIEK